MSDCPHCGAKMKEYTHSFNKHLAKCLMLLDMRGGSGALRDLDLTKAQNNNFQKLRYWHLIEKAEAGHTWEITELGRRFVTGKETINKKVITYRGETISFDGDQITIGESLGDYEYWWREQYAEFARPHERH